MRSSHIAQSASGAATAPFTPRNGTRAAIAVGLADVRRQPNADSELVTQARLWTPAQCLVVAPGWVRVRLPDYEGWVRTSEIGAPGRATRQVGVLTEFSRVPVFADAWSDVQLESIYVGTILPLANVRSPKQSNRVALRLPGGCVGWAAADTVAIRRRNEPFPPLGAVAALTLAHRLLSTPYLWGGTSPRGVDCSGLAQLCWRVGGATLPRDADQQYAAIAYLVERGDLQPGDLLFFAAHGQIDHVALSLGGERFIHASGSAGHVTFNSLDPAASDYSPLLAHMYAGARRAMPDAREPVALPVQEDR